MQLEQAEARAKAAEVDAGQLNTQLAEVCAELQEHVEYADEEVAAAREEVKLQVQQAADGHRGKLEKSCVCKWS